MTCPVFVATFEMPAPQTPLSLDTSHMAESEADMERLGFAAWEENVQL